MESTVQELTTWSEVKATYTPKVRPSQRPLISTSKDAYIILKQMYSDNMEYYESFVVMMLNKANRVIGVNLISIGGIDSTIVDVKKIFQVSLLANASNIIISHNHPSGSLFPSEMDIKVTEKVKKAAQFLEMKVLDHLILSESGYYSFADECKL